METHESEYTCPECGDKFYLWRTNDPPFPDYWFLEVAHDHSMGTGTWGASLYFRPTGARYPVAAKALQKVKADQARAEREAKAAKRRGTRKGRKEIVCEADEKVTHRIPDNVQG